MVGSFVMGMYYNAVACSMSMSIVHLSISTAFGLHASSRYDSNQLDHSAKLSRLQIVVPSITSNSGKHEKTLSRVILLLNFHQTLIVRTVEVVLELRGVRIALVHIRA